MASERDWETGWLAAITERVFLKYVDNLREATYTAVVSLRLDLFHGIYEADQSFIACQVSLTGDPCVLA